MEASGQLTYRAPDTYVGRAVAGVQDHEDAEWAVALAGDVYILNQSGVPRPQIEAGLVLSRVEVQGEAHAFYFEQYDQFGKVLKQNMIKIPTANGKIYDPASSPSPMPLALDDPHDEFPSDNLDIPPHPDERTQDRPKGWNEELGMVVSEPIVIQEEPVGEEETEDTPDGGATSEAKAGAKKSTKGTGSRSATTRKRKEKPSE